MLCWWLFTTLLTTYSSASSEKMKVAEKLIIHDDMLVRFNVSKGSTETYYYMLQQDVDSLSITLTPCSSMVYWDLSFRPFLNTGRVNLDPGKRIWTRIENISTTYEEFEAKRGLYSVRITAGEEEGSGEIFVTTLAPPNILRPTTNLTVTSRRIKGQLSVRWPPSPIDPQATNYWLVVNPVGPIHTLCRANISSFYEDTDPYTLQYNYNYQWMKELNLKQERSPRPFRGDVIIESTGFRTSAVIKGLKLNQDYTLELFAKNKDTNFSYLYANITARYKRPRPTSLKDGRPFSANLRRQDGWATFRYKVKKDEMSNVLEWYVIACGPGAVVDVEIRQKRRPVIPRTRVMGYKEFVINNPIPGSTYVLRINSTDPEMLSRINSLFVVATTEGLPVPKLPEDTSVHEVKSARDCNSVKIKWLASSRHDRSRLEYCITVKEVQKLKYFQPVPDQCGQEATWNSNKYYSHECYYQLLNPTSVAVSKEIRNLNKGRYYDITVSVKNGNSKILSYRTARVKTKSSCFNTP